MKTDIDDSSIHFKGMTELLQETGYEPSSKVLKTQTRNAGYKFSKIFHMDEDKKIFQIIRLRKGNDVPISIENTYIPFDSIRNIEEIDFQVYSLYDMLTINHIKIHDIRHVFSATKVQNSLAKLLACPDGAPVISIEITSSTKAGSIAEFTEVMVAGLCKILYRRRYPKWRISSDFSNHLKRKVTLMPKVYNLLSLDIAEFLQQYIEEKSLCPEISFPLKEN